MPPNPRPYDPYAMMRGGQPGVAPGPMPTMASGHPLPRMLPDLSNYYWQLDAGQIWGSRVAGYINSDDADYQAWLALGNKPIRVRNETDLAQILPEQFGVLPSAKLFAMFSMEEKVAIQAACSASPELGVGLTHGLLSGTITLSDAETQAWAKGLVAAGALTQQRAVDVFRLVPDELEAGKPVAPPPDPSASLVPAPVPEGDDPASHEGTPPADTAESNTSPAPDAPAPASGTSTGA